MDDKLLSENVPETFPSKLQSDCRHNYSLPGCVYPNTVRNNEKVYDVKCPAIFIAFPLIRKEEFSRMRRWKLEGEKHLKKLMPYFGPQGLFEYHYPEKDTWDFQKVPTVRQLMYSDSDPENILMVEQLWVVIYPEKSES